MAENNYYGEGIEAQEYESAQNAAQLQQTLSGINSSINGFANDLENHLSKKDIDAINGRAKNTDGDTGIDYTPKGKQKKNDDLTDSDRDTLDNSIDAGRKKKGRNDDLTDSSREELDNSIDADKKKKDKKSSGDGSDGDNNDDKDSKDDKGDKKEKKTSGDGEKLTDKVDDAIDSTGDGGFFAKLWLKIKAKLIIYAIILGIILVIIIGTVIAYAFSSIYGSFASFFGISEADTEDDLSEADADGLLTREEYLVNPETGDVYTSEELVKYLKENSECTDTGLGVAIKDWIDLIDGKSDDVCTYYRFINKYIEKKEKEGYQLDRGLVLSTLFYGFVDQPSYYDYNNPSSAEDITDAFEHYNSLVEVLSNPETSGLINKKGLTSIIDNTVLDGTYTYYEWVIDDKLSEETEEPVDEDTDIKKSVGKCEPHTAGNKGYSLYKWEIFMRFGETAAQTYEDENKYLNSYVSTDDECKMQMTDDELIARIQGASSSDMKIVIDPNVRTANAKFTRGEPGSLAAFGQMANINDGKQDTFSNYGSVEISYKNGYAYENFPAYEYSFNKPEIDLSYDSIITPKQIEETIQLVIDKKPDVNYYLGYTDLDEVNNQYSQVGDYVIGTNCEKYLTSALDAIKVNVTDCDGRSITTTTFKDYIMGVAYGEVSDSGENYVKSEMTAAISYALARRNNYSKGSTITMKSGNCDQVYCPMSTGCHGQTANLSCGSFKCTSYYPGSGWHGAASQSLIDKYSAYYDDAKNYLVVANGKVFSAHYVSTIQNGWKSKADRGIPFTQIIQEQYQGEGAQLIKCDGDDESTNPATPGDAPGEGTIPSSKYPEKAPDRGPIQGFAYNDEPEGRAITMNPAWKSANLTSKKYSCNGWSASITMHKKVVSNYDKAMDKVCDILENGITIGGQKCTYSASDILYGGSFVERKTSAGGYSLHAYGLATDFNYSLSINYNGVTYKPYATQGTTSYNEYHSFISALGSENHCKNINYVLWKNAFEPAGFNWGGNWSSGSWDGMHFEVDTSKIK